MFQGINVDGSLSKSALNDSSGGKTQLVSIAQGIFVVLTLLFLAPLFADLPSAALDAIVITAVVFGLFKVPEMRQLANMSRTEFWLAMAALLGVLTFGTLQGVFIGVVLYLLWLVWRSSHPAIPLLGKIPNETAYYSIENHLDATTYPGLVVIRFDGPLFFASASSLRTRVRELTHEVVPPVTGLVLDMESTTLIDLEGSNELQEVAKELIELHIGLYLCRTKAQIKEMLLKDGVLETIPGDHFYPQVHEAVTASLFLFSSDLF